MVFVSLAERLLICAFQPQKWLNETSALTLRYRGGREREINKFHRTYSASQSEINLNACRRICFEGRKDIAARPRPYFRNPFRFPPFFTLCADTLWTLLISQIDFVHGKCMRRAKKNIYWQTVCSAINTFPHNHAWLDDSPLYTRPELAINFQWNTTEKSVTIFQLGTRQRLRWKRSSYKYPNAHTFRIVLPWYVH